MMDWFKGIILLIGVAVYVISALAKKREEPRGSRAPLPEPKSDDESDSPRRRRSASEVDKFLEEVRRRRQAGAGTRPKPVEKPIPVAVAVEETPAPPQPRRLPQPPPLPTPTPERSLSRSRRSEGPPPTVLKKSDLPKELQRDFRTTEEALREVFRVYGFVPADVRIFHKGEDGNLRELSAEEIQKKSFFQGVPQGIAQADIPAAIPINPTDSVTTSATILGPVGSSLSMRHTLNLLKDGHSLISAMMLQEILQKPVAKRQGIVPAYRK